MLAIKGTLLANGQTVDIGAGGRPVQLSYVTCSTAEHVLLKASEGEPIG